MKSDTKYPVSAQEAQVIACDAKEDLTSREAGLAKLNPSRRREIMAASEISHNEFPVSRNAKSGEHSLLKLAKITWARNREDFERLATLHAAPGYPSAKALCCALYHFAKNYPEADHFQWLPSTPPSIKPSNHQAIQPSNLQTIKPSNHPKSPKIGRTIERENMV